MFEPLKLIEDYENMNQDAARLSGIQYAINQADMAKDYGYMLYFRYEYAESCTVENGLLRNMYLVFPEMLKIFEEHPDIEMPDYCYLSAVEVVQRVFMSVLNCADFFYQIPLSDMELYFKKFKEFCLNYGYDLDDYYMASARFFRAMDKERALHSLNEYKKCIRRNNIKNAYTIDFESEMELYFGNIDKALEISKPLFEGKYYSDNILIYQYGRFLFHYLVYEKDMERAGHYYKLLTEVRKKLHMPPVFFLDETLYLLLTVPDKAWNFYKKGIVHQTGNTVPLFYREFCIISGIMMKSLEKSGRQQVYLRFPETLPFYREDNCYQTKELGEYFDWKARDISEKLDSRNGSPFFFNEYKQYMMTVNLWEEPSLSTDLH